MNLGPFPQKFQMSYLSTRTDTNDNLMYLSYGTKTIFLVSRVPGFPDFVQTADQKFVREAFLDCIDTFARTGRPAAATGWPAFSTSPDQVPGTYRTQHKRRQLPVCSGSPDASLLSCMDKKIMTSTSTVSVKMRRKIPNKKINSYRYCINEQYLFL